MSWLDKFFSGVRVVSNPASPLPALPNLLFRNGFSTTSDLTGAVSGTPGTLIVDTTGGSFGKINLTLVNGTNSNVGTNGSSLQVIGGPTGAFALGSVRPSVALLSGQPVTFQYAGGQPFSLVHQDSAATGSSLKFSINGQTTANAQVIVFGKITVHYDGTNLIADFGSQYKHDWSIQDFGGSTANADNASAYAACNAFMTSLGGGVVRFPAGTFKSSAAYEPAKNTITQGVSRIATILARTTPGSAVYQFEGINVGGGPQTHCVFRDIGVTNTTSRPTIANNTAYTIGQIVRPKASRTCRWLQCTTAGTTPASGPEPIGQLFAPLASAPTINVTGVPSTTGVQLEVYIEDGLSTFGYSVSGGASSYQAHGVAFIPGGTVALAGTAAGLTLHFSTGTYLPSSSNNYVYTSPPFSWSLIPGALVTWGTAVFQVIDAGGGFEEVAAAYNSYFNCAAQGVEHGWIIDGSENIEIVNPYDASTSFTFWICNGPDHLPTTLDTHGNLADTQFTNVIKVYGQPQANGGGAVLDDGGIVHTYTNLSAATISEISGIDSCEFHGVYYESGSFNVPFANVSIKSYYGGQPYGIQQRGLKLSGFFNCGSAPILNVIGGVLGGFGRPECVANVELHGTYASSGGAAAVVGAGVVRDIRFDVMPISTAYTSIFDGAPAFSLGLQRSAEPSVGYFGTNLGTASPASAFDSASTFALRSASLTLGNGVNTSSALDAGSGFDNRRLSVIEISGPTAAFQISGLPGGAPGRFCTLYYYGAQACTIKNEDSTDEATAANRIHTMSGADVVVNGAGGQFVARFWWSATLSRWVLG